MLSIIFFLAIPQFFQTRGISQEQVAEISYSIASDPQPIHWLLLVAGIIIGLGVLASYFYIAAKIGRMVKDTGTFSDCVLSVVFAALSLIVFVFVSAIFSAI